MPNRRKITLPVPRCPLCDERMEEAQLYWDGELRQWQEVWGCSSCHSMHTFPARIEFMKLVKNSQQLPRAERSLFLPK